MARARKSLIVASLIPTGMLLLAVSGRWRYGFYVLLRCIVSGCAAYLASIAHDQDARAWMLIMLAIVVLFNPLIPVRLRRDTWLVIDLVAAGIFGAAAFRLCGVDHSRQGGGVP